jgi:hypothetical protein
MAEHECDCDHCMDMARAHTEKQISEAQLTIALASLRIAALTRFKLELDQGRIDTDIIVQMKAEVAAMISGHGQTRQ